MLRSCRTDSNVCAAQSTAFSVSILAEILLADRFALSGWSRLDQGMGEMAQTRYESAHQFRIELRAATALQFLDGFLRSVRFFVGAFRSDRVISVGDSY